MKQLPHYRILIVHDHPFRCARLADTREISVEPQEDETTGVQGQYYMGASRLRPKGFGPAQDDVGISHGAMHGSMSTPFTELKIDSSHL